MTAVTATVPLRFEQPPGRAEVDHLALEFFDLERRADEAYKVAIALDEPHEQMKERLILLCEEFGAADAENSRLLSGDHYEMAVSFTGSSCVSTAAVTRFREACARADQLRIVNRLFETEVWYTLRPEAAAIIGSFHLNNKLLELFCQCKVMKATTPILRVRSL
jgi:hypothetical protein